MLATLDELKDALGIALDDTTQDTLVTVSLTSANALIAGYIGGDLSDVTTDRVTTRTLASNAPYMKLPLYPVISITGVTSNGDAVASTEYQLDPELGIVDFLNGGLGTADGRIGNRVTVTFKAGITPIPTELNTVCLNIGAAIFNNGGTFNNSMNGNKGELKSLTMFDAMSMSFETGAGSSVDSAGTPAGMLKAWAFILDKYRCNSPVMA